MQYTWQLATRPRARACIFHKTLGLICYIQSLDTNNYTCIPRVVYLQLWTASDKVDDDEEDQ